MCPPDVISKRGALMKKVEVIANHPYIDELDTILRLFGLTAGDQGVPTICSEFHSRGTSGVATASLGDRRVSAAGALTDPEGVEKTVKRLVKLSLYRLLKEIHPAGGSPWGILTGVRPGKLVQYYLDTGIEQRDIPQQLMENYALSEQNARLLTDIETRARDFLRPAKELPGWVSIYVGIPFCPTRCIYCSFPAVALGRSAHLVEPYVEALLQEIQAVAKLVDMFQLRVETIYIGGGTPTTLSADQLARVMSSISAYFLTEDTREFTVEAGRPDSLDRDKLQVLKEFGATRLSINPQTMNAATLRAVGRNHTPEEAAEIFLMAREEGFDFINMDLIAGLPGETAQDFTHTLERVCALFPENITVHTLAIKRASALRQELDEIALPAEREVARMLKAAWEKITGMGMRPYYLYRQKMILGNFENIGYAYPGFESIYNIQMIEERQNVLGLGAGAVTKLIHPRDWSTERVPNAKDPQLYISRLEKGIQAKREALVRMVAESACE